MLQLLKNNRAPGVIFTGILMVLVWLPSFISLPEQPLQEGMPLYDLVFGGLAGLPIPRLLVSMLLFTMVMFLLVRLNVVHFLLEDRSYMPAAFFFMIAAAYPPALQVSPLLIASLALVAALLILIRGEEHRAEPMALFNASLLLALGSLFYLKTLLFIPFLWITASMIRPLKWRGIINPVLVLMMMALFLFTWYWVFLDDLELMMTTLQNNWTFSLREFTIPELPLMVMFGYLLFLVLISSGYLLSRFQFRKIIIRKLYQVMFVLFVYCLLFYVFASGFRSEMMIMLAIPLSFLFSNFFHRRRNHWVHNLMIWIWLLLIAWIHLEPFLF